MTELCAVVLAAGEGTRLRPLTEVRPKALCPVGNVPLLDRALARLRALQLAGPATVAVNASYLGDQVVAHAGDRVHMSVEPDRPLGTAGGLGNLKDWIDGRAVLVGNADAYLAEAHLAGVRPAGPRPTTATGPGVDLAELLAGWDGETVRLLGVPGDPGEVGTFSGFRFAGFSLLPWRWVRDLPATPGELVRAVWRPAEARQQLQVVEYQGYFRDTGTPRDYLAANLHAARGANLFASDATVTGACEQAVVGAGAVVRGRLTRSVVWPGGRVTAGEHLVDAVRAGTDLTVTLRP